MNPGPHVIPVAWGPAARGARGGRPAGLSAGPRLGTAPPLAAALAPFFGCVLPLAVLALVWGLVPGAEAWQLDWSRWAAEPWRLVTGHLVHWGREHLAWDLAVFVALGLACERRGGRARTALALAMAMAAIALLAPALTPGLRVYRGLSGLDAALFALLAASRLRSGSAAARAAGALALAALAAKVGWETVTGTPLFVAALEPAGVTVVPAAHLLGAAAGLAAGLLPAPTGSTSTRRRTGSPAPTAGSP